MFLNIEEIKNSLKNGGNVEAIAKAIETELNDTANELKKKKSEEKKKNNEIQILREMAVESLIEYFETLLDIGVSEKTALELEKVLISYEPILQMFANESDGTSSKEFYDLFKKMLA